MASKFTKDAKAWLAKLEKALKAKNAQSAAGLFAEESYWRDLVSLTWNIKTAEGRSEIKKMLEATVPHTSPGNFRIEGEAEKVNGLIETWFTFETKSARGRGHLRLKKGQGFTILTTMVELKGHEERSGPTREKGVEHGSFDNRSTWLQQRTEEEQSLWRTTQPYCVIIGGGQGGIMLGARLRRLGVPAGHRR